MAPLGLCTLRLPKKGNNYIFDNLNRRGWMLTALGMNEEFKSLYRKEFYHNQID